MSFIALFSHAEVSAKCNSTVEVVAGEAVTLNCTITTMQDNCSVESYKWNNTHGEISCNNSGLMEYSCDGVNQTYVWLTIQNVKKDENYTIEVETDCGLAKSHIKLQVQQNSNRTPGE